MDLSSNKATNIISIVALGFSIMAAGFAAWQGFVANQIQDQANQFQAQQADLTLASKVLVAKASDYPVKEWPASDDSQIIINLNRGITILDVRADVYMYSTSPTGNVDEDFMGNMRGCTELNIQRFVGPPHQSIAEVSSITYATPDKEYWNRIYAYLNGGVWVTPSSSRPIPEVKPPPPPPGPGVPGETITPTGPFVADVPPSECP